jgi:2-phospho-L-lactate/phosphoenolpyruvate guanylyltransferase
VSRTHLVVPVKPLTLAKSRLRGAVDPAAHAALVLAMVTDTVRAARRAAGVASVLVVTPDPVVALAAEHAGARVVADEPGGGLNPALRHGARLLRAEDPDTVVGALQADLPALRPADLAAAITAAAGRRAYCADRRGDGTTLLLSARGGELAPRFGPGSAAAHRASGALALRGPWASLASDVDTAADLRAAARLGLGVRTAGVLATPARAR